ncbi:MAG TPA: hypothetical protein VG165_16590 [Solirubrobacteraceae bacterium]|nr:hypothetical protein [Solirubrobacteraceae bacterium]
MNGRHDICGQAHSLTVLTSICAGHESALARYLNALGSGPASPLSHVGRTHFARWVVVGDVVFEGTGERDHLQFAQLLFTSNFDGTDLDSYLESLRTGLGVAADEIWSHCNGYPGSGDPAAFAAYMRRHHVESSLFFAAYGARTVEDVTSSLALRNELIAFAMSTQGLPPADLQSAFERRFPR